MCEKAYRIEWGKPTRPNRQSLWTQWAELVRPKRQSFWDPMGEAYETQ